MPSCGLEIKREFMHALQQLEALPDTEQRALLAYVRDRACGMLGALTPSLPDPRSAYPRYEGGDALSFLEENWGQYLRYFNPELEQDLLYQDWLRTYDPPLMTALDVQARQRHHMKLAKIVPPKKVRLDLVRNQVASMKGTMISTEPT